VPTNTISLTASLTGSAISTGNTGFSISIKLPKWLSFSLQNDSCLFDNQSVTGGFSVTATTTALSGDFVQYTLTDSNNALFQTPPLVCPPKSLVRSTSLLTLQLSQLPLRCQLLLVLWLSSSSVLVCRSH
jgi:hypothetical protein